MIGIRRKAAQREKLMERLVKVEKMKSHVKKDVY